MVKSLPPMQVGQKMREFITIRAVLQEIVKEGLGQKENNHF